MFEYIILRSETVTIRFVTANDEDTQRKLYPTSMEGKVEVKKIEVKEAKKEEVATKKAKK